MKRRRQQRICQRGAPDRLRQAAVLLLTVFVLTAGGCGKKADFPAPAEETAQTEIAPTEQAGSAPSTEISPSSPAATHPTTPENAPIPTEAQEQTTAPRTTLTTNGGSVSLSSLAHRTEDESAPVVWFTKNITAEALLDLYTVLTPGLPGKVAVKLTTGESQATNFLKPALIGDLVKKVDGTIIECMTAYGGVRSSAALSKQAAKDRGYTAIAPFDLLDENGDKEIPYTGEGRVTRAIVGSHIDDYDSVLVLSHFKGHPMAGFGGAIKNVGIGMSSRKGKIYVHSAGTRTAGTIIHADQNGWLEALAEAVKAVSDYENDGKNMLYISVMNRLSVDCDCMALPAQPDMHDVGMLASADPVALDQACVDLVYAAPDGGSLIARMEALNGVHVLEHAEAIGLGSRTYRLVTIDE